MPASRQIRKANGLAERLGRRHGVPVMVTWLSVQQHGAAQPFRRKDMAALLAAEGAYLFAAMAEQPGILPVDQKGARKLGRKLTASMGSVEAERSSVFLAHGLLAFAVGNFAETGDDALRLVARTGRAILDEHYPLAVEERGWLGAAGAAFTEGRAVTSPPSSGVTVPTFVVRSSAKAIGIALGSTPPAADHGMLGWGPVEAAQIAMPLTGLWFESAKRGTFMVRDWLKRETT